MFQLNIYLFFKLYSYLFPLNFFSWLNNSSLYKLNDLSLSDFCNTVDYRDYRDMPKWYERENWSWEDRVKHYAYDPNELDEGGGTDFLSSYISMDPSMKMLFKNEYETHLKGTKRYPNKKLIDSAKPLPKSVLPDTKDAKPIYIADPYNQRINIRYKDVVYGERYTSFFKWYEFPSKWVFHVRRNYIPYDVADNDRIYHSFYNIFSGEPFTHYEEIGIIKHSSNWSNKFSINFDFFFFDGKLQFCMYQVLYYSFEIDYFYYFHWYKLDELYLAKLYSNLIDLFNFIIICLFYMMQFFILLKSFKKKESDFYSSYKYDKCVFFINVLYRLLKTHLYDIESTLSLLRKYIYFLYKTN